MVEITNEFIHDIFNIPRDGSNISDDDAEITIQDDSSVATFEEKAKELAQQIATLPPSPALKIKEEQKVTMAENSVSVQTQVKKVAKNRFSKDLFDDTEPAKPAEVPVSKTVEITVPVNVVQIGTKDKPATVEEINNLQKELSTKAASVFDALPAKETDPKETPQVEEFVKNVEEIRQPVSVVMANSKVREKWNLHSPAPKYDKFYEEKASLLSNTLLRGGEIPFEKYYDELGDASVDIDVPTWDTEEVGKRISLVQKWRDRIKYIQLHANQQYFVWERFMELLPGVLARIEYERGKQEGLVFEHLNDFESYFGTLKGLHKSCEAVTKNLDAAYASLSRQVSIVQPLQEAERWNNSTRQMTPAQQRYDSVPMHANNKLTGVSLTKKEAGNTAEPNQGWDKVPG